MMTRSTSRITSKDIISVVLVLAIVAAAASAASSIVSLYSDATERLDTVSSFSVGGLNSSGNLTNDKTSLVTPDMFECQGLAIEVDFEAELTYRVFYYRENGNYIGSTGEISVNYTKEGYDNAKYARIVVYPTLEDGKTSIKIYEVYSYVKNLKISVSEDQTFISPVSQAIPDIQNTYFSSMGEFYGSHGSAAVPWTAYTTNTYTMPIVLGGNRMNVFEQTHVCRIGIPVSLVADINQDCMFTVYVVEGDGSTAFKKISEHQLTIPAGTYKDYYTVAESNDIFLNNGWIDSDLSEYYIIFDWYYFDVEIEVGDNQTLAFGSAWDTVVMPYNQFTSSERENANPTYVDAFNSPVYMESIEYHVDVWYE